MDRASCCLWMRSLRTGAVRLAAGREKVCSARQISTFPDFDKFRSSASRKAGRYWHRCLLARSSKHGSGNLSPPAPRGQAQRTGLLGNPEFSPAPPDASFQSPEAPPDLPEMMPRGPAPPAGLSSLFHFSVWTEAGQFDDCSDHRCAQRPFFVEPLPGFTFEVGNGELCAAGDFAIADFGFFFSRLLFWSPLAISVSF